MSTRPISRLPKYRHYLPKDLAVVRIDGKDFYLGPYGSPESREKYSRLIAEWLATRSGIAPISPTQPSQGMGLTVDELILAYFRFAEGYYRKGGRPTVEQSNIRLVLRLVRRLYGSSPVATFGPLSLKALREEMIRAGNCRTEINRRVQRIVRMFKWGVSEELVPPAIYEALKSVTGLMKGRSTAVEKPPVGPVPDAQIEAIMPHVSRQVWAMVQLQALTGMRPGEVVIMRAGDIDRTGQVWIYKPGHHKTEHHSKDREIYLGPKAQFVLSPLLENPLSEYLFSPADAMKERRENLRHRRMTPVQPSQRDRRKSLPEKRPGDHYTVASYRRAIQAACKRAGIPKWHPHQLRHWAATEIRRQFGLEASRVILGHEDIRTAQIYAEEDRSKGIEIMRAIG